MTFKSEIQEPGSKRNPKSECHTPVGACASAGRRNGEQSSEGRPSEFTRILKFEHGISPVLLLVILTLFVASSAPAQNISPTMVASLLATQGQTLSYTSVIANVTGANLSGVTFSVVLDPNTTLIPGSLNTSPLAFADTYSALGNVQITIPAPGVLANDVDPDGVGPALTVTSGNFISANGGAVAISANGGFTYNPPRGFEGVDTFTYVLNDGEGFLDFGNLSISVSGMIWFVNGAASEGGDGRLTKPFNTLAALAAINNGSDSNPAAGDSIFLYSGSYPGPVTLLANQKLIGQGAGASLSTITGLTPPTGSLALPATGGARPTITGNGTGMTLSSGNSIRGLNLSHGGGVALVGVGVGVLTISEMAVTNTAGPAVNLAGGALNVSLGSVAASGGANGIRLVNCTGSFAVTGDGATAQNGTGGTIQNTTGNAIQLENVSNISLARMNINNSAANGILGQNVNGLVVDWCILNNNGDAVNESGILLGDPVAGVNGLTGSVPGGSNPTRIANTLVRASGEMNVAIYNNGGTLAQLDVTNLVSKDTRTRPLGADGFYFETRGAAVATVNLANCSFSNNFTQGLQVSALAQSVLAINVANCGFTNNNEGVVLANANDADLIFDLNNNRFFNNLATGASGAAVAVVNATTVTGNAIYSGKVRNNTILGGGIDNHVVTALLAGAGNDTLQVANNNISAANSQFSGIFVQAGETGSGNPNASVTVTGNSVSVGTLGSHGIVLQSRITSTLCAEIANNVASTAGAGLFGINVRQRDTSTFRLPGFTGPFNSPAAVIAFLQSRNAGSTAGSTVATAYSGGAACVLPLLAMPDESRPVSVLQPVVVRNESVDPALLRAPQTSGNVDTIPVEMAARSTSLTPDQLTPILAAARQRWADTGLTREQLAVIDSLRFEVNDLAGWYLGASAGRVVQLDRRATGYGWFIDPSPETDEEFAGPLPVSAPSRRIDLLSAVLHEMGHNLGLADDYTPAARGNVMYGFLTPGERRLPVRGQARDAVADMDSGTHYMFTPLNLGTLPAGKTITITFRVAIANQLPPGICLISNQGRVDAVGTAGVISVLTDDPRTAIPGDPTVTALPVPPIATTQPATSVASDSATLNGFVNPCGSPASYYFQYGTSTAYGSTTPTFGLPLPAGANPVPVSAAISGLQPGETYHFRLIAENTFGTNAGADLTFVVPLEILQQPADAAACVGGSVTFLVAVGAGDVSFQWQRRASGAPTFTDISGATDNAYTVPAVAAGDDGAAFRVIVSGPGSSIASTEAFLSVISIASPTITYDFNSGLPANTAVYGSAYVDAGTGVLELNPNAGGLTGAFLTADLAPGRVARGFAATFKARLSEGSFPPADGFSFNWATDLPNGTYAVAEEGEGSGLRVCIDTWDNGFGEAPAIDVWWGPNLIARKPVSIPFLVRGPDFFDVQIRLSPDGLLDVTYACEPIFVRLPVTGYAPQIGARFGLGSRTGGAWETHSIDDLALELYLDPTNGLPRITSIIPQFPVGLLISGTGSPDQSHAIEASSDFVTWVWRAEVVANAIGDWEFLEPGILTPPYQFYRLRTAPQVPAGLINWWRADDDYLDAFGPYNGTPINGLGFAPGQRGSAFSFDGLGQAMQLGGAPVPPPWTACFWVNRQDTPSVSAALLTDPATGLKLEQWNNTRQVGFTQFGVADYYFSYIVPLDTWTHVTFVCEPGGMSLYIHGALQEVHSATINLPRGVIGGLSAGGDPLKGSLDEITLFNRALSPAEIQQVINATRGP